MKLCRFLRWKTGYGDLYRNEDELIEILARNEVPFRCLRTQQPWGPDEAAAWPEQCDAARTCFEGRGSASLAAQRPREDDAIG